ncbi:MAG: DUF2283 domain-containing protein [Actinomycetota bacterium]
MELMRITFDREANIAYFQFSANKSRLRRTIELEGHGLRGDLLLDVDEQGRIVGLEVTGASQVLPNEILSEARRLPPG